MENNIMKKLLAILTAAILVNSCSIVPVTGRHQLNMIPDSTMLSMSYQQYDEFLKSNKKSTNSQQTKSVKKVGKRIQKAVEKFLADNGMADRISGYNWEFNLVDSPEQNAWCMPGGKVVIYSGILPLTESETGLAVVMGHEIAHAIAEHGNERMSQQMLVQMGGTALSTAMQNKPAETQKMWQQVYGLGTQYGAVLPYSRLQESEADKLGLIFMSIAGYDPREAIPFWQRMSDHKKGEAPPEFMSTHPADATRINKIKKDLSEALEYYIKK